MPYLAWKSFNWDKGGLPILEAIKDKDSAFFLDSSLRGKYSGRYSFLGFEPFCVLKTDNSENPFGRTREMLLRYRLKDKGYDFPFLGGAVGYFSYDLGLDLERIRKQTIDDLKLPGLLLGFYDALIAIDHLQGKLIVFSTGFPEQNYLLAKKRSEQRLRQIVSLLSGIRPKRQSQLCSEPPQPHALRLSSNFTQDKYLESVKIAKDYIRRGDIYQVNLSQRFCARLDEGPLDLYSRLRRISPSSFSAYLDCGDFQILSSSPERFLHFDGKKVTTRPMKGTRPRGRSQKEDKLLRKELLESAKDKAELIMIVDLLRNDLGRVCEYGSVKVAAMRVLEKYSTVYQTTATVEGRLHPDKDRIDLLRACFPGGSITGCPKIRSMRIIEELEPCRRSIYTGSLGYLSFNDAMDLNILIRTILRKDDKIYFQVGGGIVADSNPQREYKETLVKAEGILRSIRGM